MRRLVLCRVTGDPLTDAAQAEGMTEDSNKISDKHSAFVATNVAKIAQLRFVGHAGDSCNQKMSE